MTLESLIAHYGVAAIFLGSAVEGETVATLGGLLVARHVIGYWPAVAAAVSGSFVADQMFFLIGRRMREHRLVREAQARPAFARAKRALEQHPTGFILGFRFLYGLRTISPIAIGTTDVPTARFVILNAIAATIWGFGFVTLGRFFGGALRATFGHIYHFEHWIIVAIAIAALLAIAVGAIRRFRLSAARNSRLDGEPHDPLGRGDE